MLVNAGGATNQERYPLLCRNLLQSACLSGNKQCSCTIATPGRLSATHRKSPSTRTSVAVQHDKIRGMAEITRSRIGLNVTILSEVSVPNACYCGGGIPLRPRLYTIFFSRIASSETLTELPLFEKELHSGLVPFTKTFPSSLFGFRAHALGSTIFTLARMREKKIESVIHDSTISTSE